MSETVDQKLAGISEQSAAQTPVPLSAIHIAPRKEIDDRPLWSAAMSPAVDDRPAFFRSEDTGDRLQERREREFDRRSRELDRRERELERRERELERRQREYEVDKARWMTEVAAAPRWQEAIERLQTRLDTELVVERQKGAAREAELESKLMAKVHETLEKERQLYGVIRMSDNEVNEMVENSVGYLLQSVSPRPLLQRIESNMTSGRGHRRSRAFPEPAIPLSRETGLRSGLRAGFRLWFPFRRLEARTRSICRHRRPLQQSYRNALKQRPEGGH